MAKFVTRSIKEGRQNVGDLAPLSSPLTILVEPASVCSLKCNFCPTGDYQLSKETGKYQGFIDIDLFRKIVTDIKEANWTISALHLHKDGEPLLHPQFTNLCRIAKDSGCFEKIETLTNATLLKNYNLRDLATCGLTRIKISLYGLSDEEYRQNCRTSVNYRQLRASIASLYAECKANDGPEVFIKIMDEKVSSTSRQIFLSDYADICDTYHIEHAVDLWPSDSSTLTLSDITSTSDIFGNTLESSRKVVCPQPFYQMSITADGWVLPCCPDWQCVNKLYNVKEVSLYEVWHSSKLKEFQLMMLNGQRFDHSLCGSCNYPDTACVDDLDSYRQDILNRLSY